MGQHAETISAAERAYRSTRDAILDGTHPPGTMLGEASLASGLGVSRTPVRAALTRLENEGWIVVYPKRGAMVQGLDERTVGELADARFILESTAVDRAPEELRRSLADRLEEEISQQREAFAERDLRRVIELMLRFHRGFVEAGGSGVLLELYDRLADRQRFALFAGGGRLLARADEVLAQHEKLAACLREGDAIAFSQVLSEHFTENGAVRRGLHDAPALHVAHSGSVHPDRTT